MINNSIAISAETQSIISPEMAQEILEAGNKRFLQKRMLNRNLEEQVKITGGGQHPFAVVLACIDSRVPVEIIFDQGIGDIFSARVAGNFINTDILGSMEFACKLAGSKLVVVLGHTSCGAVKGACDDVQLGNLTSMLANIKPAVDSVQNVSGERNSSNADFVQAVVEANTHMAVDDIRKKSPLLKQMEDDGEIRIVGALYDVKTGEVTFS